MLDLKPVEWIATSKTDFLRFPSEVQDAMGYALYLAQVGGMHVHAKPLKGFGGGGVVELVESHRGGAYRAVYTVRFVGAVYVLHAFQKKSRKGVKTDAGDIEMVRRRLRIAEERHRQLLKESRHGQSH